MINSEKMENIMVYMKASAKFDTTLNEYVRKFKGQSHVPEFHCPFIMGTLLFAVTRSLINPVDEDNTPEMNNAIDMNKLMGTIGDRKAMQESVRLLDASFSNKHKRIFNMLKVLEEGSTITSDEYDDSIVNKDKEINEIANEYVISLTSIFNSEAQDDPLNAVAGLSLFAIQAIRMSVYSHGVENHPNHKILVAMLDLK